MRAAVTLITWTLCSGMPPQHGEDCSQQIDLIGTGASQAAAKVDALGHSYARYRNSQGRNVNFKVDQNGKNNLQFYSMSSKYAIDQLMKNRTIDGNPLLFAVSSVKLDAHEKKMYPNLRMFPIMAWPMVVVFNLPGHRELVLNARHLPLIYMGKIRYWDDPAIREVNPGMKLPHKKIIPIASAGSSGDARIITEAFSAFDDDWRDTYGIITDPKFATGYCCNSTTWPHDVVRHFGKRTLGMTGLVASIPYTIGYLALSGSNDLDLAMVSLQNMLGYRVAPTSEGIRAAVEYNHLNNPDDLLFSLSNAPVPEAYPIVSFNYFILNISTTPGISCCQMEELAGFVEFTLSQSGEFFESQGAIGVTEHVADTVIRVILNDMRCGGENSYVRFKLSTARKPTLAAWKLGLYVAVGVVAVGVVSFIAYLIVRMRVTEKNNSKQWIIDSGLVKKGTEGSSGSSVSFKSLAGIKAEFDHSAAMLCELNVPPPQRWQSNTKKEVVRLLRAVNHHSALDIIGFTVLDGTTYIVTELPGKGTLRHTLKSAKFDLHVDFKMALSMNLLQGLSYLHSKNVVHGLLNSQTCYVDSSWCLKIGQWLDLAVYQRENPMALSDLILGDTDMMTNEELLRVFFIDPRAYQGIYDKAGDIFALGLLVFEVFTFNKDTDMRTPEMMQIVKNKLKKGTSELPTVTQEYPRSIEFLVRMCLGEPSSRPTIEVMTNEIKKLRTNSKGIVDMLMETMETYAAKLEAMVQERSTELEKKTRKLTEVTQRMEELLHEVLPPMIATKLLKGEKVEPESFECVTIYFSDIIGFADISAKSTPQQIMDFLNDLWKMFDNLLERYDVYKVDTIGDAYMVCSGLPLPNGFSHAREISLLSLDLLQACANFTFKHMPGQKLEIRIGINSGPVVTGVVGAKMPQYCVFGDAVNTASRMESTSQAMHIQVSQATHDILVKHYPTFRLTYRGNVEVKGKGSMETYWMEPDLNVASKTEAKFVA